MVLGYSLLSMLNHHVSPPLVGTYQAARQSFDLVASTHGNYRRPPAQCPPLPQEISGRIKGL